MDQATSDLVTMNSQEPRPDLPKATSDGIGIVFGIMSLLSLVGMLFIVETSVNDYARIMGCIQAVFAAAIFAAVARLLNYLKRIAERLEKR